MTYGESEVESTVEPGDGEMVDSLMVTVSIVGPDGTSWHGSGHQPLPCGTEPGSDQVVRLLIRAASGACMAHDDDTWLALRRALTRYPVV